jgi:hypothetical protein
MRTSLQSSDDSARAAKDLVDKISGELKGAASSDLNDTVQR